MMRIVLPLKNESWANVVWLIVAMSAKANQKILTIIGIPFGWGDYPNCQPDGNRDFSCAKGLC
jgi:hypothetical protein